MLSSGLVCCEWGKVVTDAMSNSCEQKAKGSVEKGLPSPSLPEQVSTFFAKRSPFFKIYNLLCVQWPSLQNKHGQNYVIECTFSSEPFLQVGVLVLFIG